MWKPLILLLSLVAADPTSQPCRPIRYSDDRVDCVCIGSYCDTLDAPVPTRRHEYVIVTSSRSGDRFDYTRGQLSIADRYVKLKPLKPLNINTTYIKIKDISTGRRFEGMGGTYTGSVAYSVSQMSAPLQENFYLSFYSNGIGNGFNKIRLPIGGTANDFQPWTYADSVEGTTTLGGITITNREDRLRLAQLQALLNVTENVNIDFMAIPSTAPRWMKTIFTYFGSTLRPAFYQAWSDYLIGYLTMMQNSGISITSISTGQRPNTSPNVDQTAPSMAWDPVEQGKWLAQYFGPAIRSSNFANISIQAYDDDRQMIPLWVSLMNLGNISALNYIDAINIQGYADQLFLPSAIDLTFSTFLGKSVLSSEMSFDGPPLPGSWQPAEDLIVDIYENLLHDVEAYLLLNLLIDANGGPTLNNNNRAFDAPIVVDNGFTQFLKRPMYYAISHFSRYIQPGSMRLDTFSFGTNSANILVIAYLQPDGTVVVILYNTLTIETNITVSDRFEGSIDLSLQPKSINTLIY